MEMKKAKTMVVGGLLALLGLLVFSLSAVAGSLEPSGSPAPTMKTLDEVEPRIPIPGSATPAATFTISQPGSYYLTGDRLCSGTGISVDVNDVTIDLMGYSLIGPGSNYGIYMNGRSNVEIRNGTVRDFGYYGIAEMSYFPFEGSEHRVIAVRAVSNGGNGIYLMGKGHLVKDCTVAMNQGSGIITDYCSTVTGNIAYKNNFRGIEADYECTVTGNTACSNGDDGIYTSSSSTVTGNTSNSNQGSGISASSGSTVTGNTAYYNEGHGIHAEYGCTVTGNTLRSNNQSNQAGYAGIRVSEDCVVKGNTLSLNMQNNIFVYLSDNVIEENLVTGSTNGICFNATTGVGNFYANNRASGNTTDYNDPGGNTNGGGNVSF